MQLRKEKGSAVQPLNASKEVGGITTKPNSANKVKDLIHNTQENDKKVNLIKNINHPPVRGAVLFQATHHLADYLMRAAST